MEGPELITKYAVLARNVELRMHVSAVAPCDQSEVQTIKVAAGTLIKVFQSQLSVSSSSKSSKQCTVQVLDLVRHNPMFENLYECAQTDLLKVSETLWPYVISIAEPEQRLRLVQNVESCRWIVYLKPHDMVRVAGSFFGKNNVSYVCIIRYIGPVEEMHPVGYFFGLELLNLDGGHSPQSEDIPFSIKYMQTDPSLSIFTTANYLQPLLTEEKKKFAPLDLISETIDKVRTAIGPSSCTQGPSNTSSLRKPKKLKKKEPTAQFYTSDSSLHLQDSNNYNTNNSQQNGLQLTVNSNSAAMDAHPILSSLDSDEYKQSIENYEKNVERQHANIQQQQTQTPAGILKHRRTPSGGGGAKDATNKPLKVMSMEDRDIIVIDNNDIRESTKHESDVIVVDKIDRLRPQEVDLADVLGNNWPNTAGDAASMLNKPLLPKLQLSAQSIEQQAGGSSNNSSLTKGGRNKSPNPLAHLIDRPNAKSNLLPTTATTKTSTVAVDSYNVADANTSNATAAATDDLTMANKYNNSRDSPVYDNLIDVDAVGDLEYTESTELLEVPDTCLGVGSMVEVSIPDVADNLYGVIRWIGNMPGRKQVMVGVELEEDQDDRKLSTSDGTFNGVQLFKCHEGRALFVAPDSCSMDRRFVETDGSTANKCGISLQPDSKMFGQVECPSVAGSVPPLKIYNLEELEEICGKFKGIQGHHNSCYLDATLFSMFTFTSVFDSLLFRPPDSEDIPSYKEVQKVLREEIVNPLRKHVFVRADRVMKLRQLLDKLSSVSGLTSEEKDPEEFLNSLLAQIMRVEPFLKLSSGQDAYFYQLFVEKDERLCFPTVQQLFEQSFHASDIKLKEVPSCLIIQMPRFGKNYKMYPRILPSQVLDVTDIIEDSPRQCTVCGKLAEFECRDCYGVLQGGGGLECTAFCRKCLDTVHMHARRTNHTWKKLSVPQDFRIMAEHMTVPRLYMELFAVVCIETSHYVAFVKAASGADAPWCFFDSMADRKGEKNGYNIPEMITVPDLPQWLSEEGARAVNETSSNDKMLPEHAKRLFCDAYMCMYQSKDVMMYR